MNETKWFLRPSTLNHHINELLTAKMEIIKLRIMRMQVLMREMSDARTSQIFVKNFQMATILKAKNLRFLFSKIRMRKIFFTWHIQGKSEADLLHSVSDIRVKRDTELWTHHHQVVCNLNLAKPPGPTQTCRASRSYRRKWEALADKDARKSYADGISSLIRELPEYTVDAVRGGGVAAFQTSCNFICCSGMRTEATR